MGILAYNTRLLAALLCLLVASAAFGERYEEKQKVINKTFDVTSSVELEIDNKHGEVDINTWDKNVIELKITIKAGKRTIEKAQELLNKITIDINDRRSSNLISVRTEINGNINNKGGEYFKINYEINMPKGNPLDLTNRHGATYLADFNGPLKVRVAHGKFKGGEIKSKDASLDTSFGGTELKSFASGEIEIRHGSLDVGVLGNVDVTCAHSDAEIGKAKSIDLDMSHGNIEIDAVDNLEGSLAHSSLCLGKLNNNLRMDAQHAGSFEVEEVAANFGTIDLDGQFTTFELTLDRNTSCKFDAKMSFGDVRYNGSDIDMKYVNEQNNSAEYRTVIGSNQSPASSIRVRAQHGDLKLHIND